MDAAGKNTPGTVQGQEPGAPDSCRQARVSREAPAAGPRGPAQAEPPQQSAENPNTMEDKCLDAWGESIARGRKREARSISRLLAFAARHAAPGTGP